MSKREYCSRECQKGDWSEHKATCKALLASISTEGSSESAAAVEPPHAVSDAPDTAAEGSAAGAAAAAAGDAAGVRIGMSMEQRQAFQKLTSQLVQSSAGALGCLAVAWRHTRHRMIQRLDGMAQAEKIAGKVALHMPVIVIEIDHAEAEGSGWRWPFTWRAIPFFPIKAGRKNIPASLAAQVEGPAAPEVYRFLENTVGLLRSIETLYEGMERGLLGSLASTGPSTHGLLQGDQVLIATITTAHSVHYTRLQALTHYSNGGYALRAALEGKRLKPVEGQRLPGARMRSWEAIVDTAHLTTRSMLVVAPTKGEEEAAVPTSSYSWTTRKLEGKFVRGHCACEVDYLQSMHVCTSCYYYPMSMHEAQYGIVFTGSVDHINVLLEVQAEIFPSLARIEKNKEQARQVYEQLQTKHHIQRMAWPLLVNWAGGDKPWWEQK